MEKVKIADIIIGQEAVVPKYGLGRIVQVTDTMLYVKPYICDYPMAFDPNNVQVIKLNPSVKVEK